MQGDTQPTMNKYKSIEKKKHSVFVLFIETSFYTMHADHVNQKSMEEVKLL